jgi:hypothetical protein
MWLERRPSPSYRSQIPNQIPQVPTVSEQLSNTVLALITSEEIEASLSLLFKIGIQADMKQRGINKFEDYVDVLVKEYPPKVSTNPLP